MLNHREMRLLAELRSLLYVQQNVIYPPVDRLPRNLAYIQQHHYDNCEILFRFRFDYLVRLHTALRMPVECRLENGSVISSQEVFLFSLCRLTFPDRLHTMSVDMWGGEQTLWSRAFKYFNIFIDSSMATDYVITLRSGYLILKGWQGLFNASWPILACSISQKSNREYVVSSMTLFEKSAGLVPALSTGGWPE